MERSTMKMTNEEAIEILKEIKVPRLDDKESLEQMKLVVAACKAIQALEGQNDE